MLFRNKTLILVVCFFLVGFKIMAASTFISVALERAQYSQALASSSADFHHLDKSQRAHDKHLHATTLNLMSHVLASLTEVPNTIPLLSCREAALITANESAHTQTFPDSLFRPPRGNS
jgi:hypothetical protein